MRRTSLRTLSLAAAGLVAAAVSLSLSGCGAGRSGGSAPAATRAAGSLTFTVAWPKPGRLIPLAANSITIKVSRGANTVAQQVVNKPESFSEATPPSTVTIGGLEVGASGSLATYTVTADAHPERGGTGTVQASATTFVSLTTTNASVPVSLTMASTIRRVEVQPASGPNMRVGGTRSFSAVAYDAETGGNIVLVYPTRIEWTNSNPGVGTLSAATGNPVLFTATAPGGAELRATDTESGVASATAAVATIVQTGLAQSTWAKYHGDAQNTGRAGNEVNGIAENGNLAWEFATGDTVVFSSPAVGHIDPVSGDFLVYIGSYDGRLYAVDGKTGAEVWHFDTGGFIDSSPAIGKDGTVYVGSSDKNVYALNGDSGDVLWMVTTGAPVLGGATISNDGFVYIGSGDPENALYKIDSFDGSIVWKYQAAGGIQTTPALSHDQSTVYVGSLDGKVHAVSAATGTAVGGWPVDTGGAIFSSSPAVDGDGTVYVGSLDGKLYSFHADGTAKWTAPFDTGAQIYATPAIAADGTVYVASFDINSGDENSRLYAVDARTGQAAWQYPAASAGTIGTISSSPAVGIDGAVIFGSYDGHVYSVSSTGAQKWAFDTGDIVESSPAIGPDGTVYVGGYTGKMYAVK